MAFPGKVFELDPASVSQASIEQLQKTILTPHEPSFTCPQCGAHRKAPADVNDPGKLIGRDLTCEQAGQKCKTPPTPPVSPPLCILQPGSLVFAPLKDGACEHLWPAIVEHCPDGTNNYMIAGKFPHSKPEAYYVTYIFPKSPGQRWAGAYQLSENIQPIQKLTSFPSGVTAAYRESVLRAWKALDKSLNDRLRLFSFVAHVAKQRGIRLPLDPPKEEPKETQTEDWPSWRPGPPATPKKTFFLRTVLVPIREESDSD